MRIRLLVMLTATALVVAVLTVLGATALAAGAHLSASTEASTVAAPSPYYTPYPVPPYGGSPPYGSPPYGTPPYGGPTPPPCLHHGAPGCHGSPYPVSTAGSRGGWGRNRRRCASDDARAVTSRRRGSRHELVPHGAVRVTVCIYNGVEALHNAPQWGLLRAGGSRRRATLRKLTRELDHLKRLGKHLTVSCPVDQESDLIARFGYRSGRADTVKIDLGGCGQVSNGHVQRLFADGPITNQLRSLTSRIHARWPTLSGAIVKFRRTSGRGHTVRKLLPGATLRAGRVVIYTRSGRVLAFTNLAHHHFKLQLAARGHFRVVLYGRGREINKRIVMKHVRVRRSHTHVVFLAR